MGNTTQSSLVHSQVAETRGLMQLAWNVCSIVHVAYTKIPYAAVATISQELFKHVTDDCHRKVMLVIQHSSESDARRISVRGFSHFSCKLQRTYGLLTARMTDRQQCCYVSTQDNKDPDEMHI